MPHALLDHAYSSALPCLVVHDALGGLSAELMRNATGTHAATQTLDFSNLKRPESTKMMLIVGNPEQVTLTLTLIPTLTLTLALTLTLPNLSPNPSPAADPGAGI